MVRQELEVSRQGSKVCSAKNARLVAMVTQTSDDFIRVKFEVE